MPSHERSSSNLNSPTNSSKDDLSKVELSDLDASPPPRNQLPVEQDLMQLARLGELRSIQKLLDSGKHSARDVDEQGITALHWAAINGHDALCHFLLQAGADVNTRGGDADATPVLWASKRCNLQVVALLLAHGADPLLRDDQGYNLLHSATLDGNVFQLIMLLHHPDIPVDAPDAQGHTSLMWAAYKGFGACVYVLLRWGADVRAADEMGFTALHWALVKGNYLCIQKLVEFGSDRSRRSKPPEGQVEGDTPAMTAEKMRSDVQWRRALVDSGYDEEGRPSEFPVPFVKDRRWFLSRFFFLWPFALGGLQLYMLAHMPVYFAIPAVLMVGYGLQYLVQRLLRWGPPDMKHMHRTPFLAGIFAGSLFWVGVQYFLHILPWTFESNMLFNLAFVACFALCTYFYALTMTEDPGFVPKGGSRGQTKKTIDELLDHNAFDEMHFCTQCMIRRPLRSKHCKRCGRCIAREDHHCPWVDNCIGVNNHKHFLLYIISLIGGIALDIHLTIIYTQTLPPPPITPTCTLLNESLCAHLAKDPLTLLTTAWAALQLTWTLALLIVHLTQIARGLTTYETMRQTPGHHGPVMTAVATGSTTPAGASLGPHGAGPDPVTATGASHAHRKKEGCLAQWAKLLGLDTFFAIAFQGYHGSKRGGGDRRERPAKRGNPFSRGVMRNCQDFWMDGPVFGRKEEGGLALLCGGRVDYRGVFEVPRGGMGYAGGGGGGYEVVPGLEEGR